MKDTMELILNISNNSELIFISNISNNFNECVSNGISIIFE